MPAAAADDLVHRGRLDQVCPTPRRSSSGQRDPAAELRRRSPPRAAERPDPGRRPATRAWPSRSPGRRDRADLTQQADNLKIRTTEEGTVYPAPLATVPSIRFEGAGFPDYPWMFATDQEYTMFALLAAGQFGTAEDGLRSLARVSMIANHDSGKVVHETVTDGSVYFGLNDEKGDIDETAKFPDAVAMVWRWTGDNAFRDQMYAFTKKNMQYMLTLIKGDDPWPSGAANVESDVLGPDAVDAAVYTIRGFYDLADMAASKGDTATKQWADSHAATLVKKFSAAWWMPGIPQFADSLADGGKTQLMQRWWTGVTPMEAQLYPDGVPTPGLVPPSEALPALKLRETRATGHLRPVRRGRPRLTRAPTPVTTAGLHLNTGVMAVGLAITACSARASSSATPTTRPLQLGSVPSSPARCRRSARRPTSPPTSASPSTSGPRWTRPGAPTACSGRW